MRIPILTGMLERGRIASKRRQLQLQVLDRDEKLLAEFNKTFGDASEDHSFLNDTAFGGGFGHAGAHGDPFGHIANKEHIRSQSRVLIATNSAASGVIFSLMRMVFGKGFVFRAVDPTAQDLWDKFAKANKWSRRQNEWGKRCFRDGEQFTRKFSVKTLEDWPPKIRFMEPELIDDPTSQVKHGIEFEPDDAEVPRFFFKIDPNDASKPPEPLSADEVQHTKILVDLATPRGVPLLNVTVTDLEQLQRTRWAMGKKAEIAAYHVLVQRYVGASPTELAAIAAKKKLDHPVTDFQGRELQQEQFHPGMHVLANDSVQYEWQGPDIGAGEQQLVARDQALAVGANVGLPEYIVRGDASNANRASQQVAETQALVTTEAWQDFFADEFRLLWDWVMLQATKAGASIADTDVTIQAPEIPRGDQKAFAEALRIYKEDGALSVQSYSAKLNLAYETEQELRKEHAAAGREAPQATDKPPAPEPDERGPEADEDAADDED